MSDIHTKDIMELMEEELQNNPALAQYEQTWGALASFIIDYEHLKGLNKLTQSEIAQACGTTQSAISRLERMRGKPTYELLRKLSNAVGGELLITPLSDVTITLPYDLHDRVRTVAEAKGMNVQDFMRTTLREGIEREEFFIAGEECTMRLVSSGTSDIPYGDYSDSPIEGDGKVAV
jgi:transcriptional regulator with XRE-family HTH domain